MHSSILRDPTRLLIPADLPAALADVVDNANFRGVTSPHDVVVLIKKFICDKELSQPPLLAMSYSRSERFALVPEGKNLV